MARVVTTADTTMKPAKVAHALRVMRAYLEDCAIEGDEVSNRRTEELNGVIRACAERLAIDRRDDVRIRDPRLPGNALGYAIRYVDEHLDAKLKWDDMRSQPAMDALAHFKGSIGMARYIIRSRLQGAMKLLRDTAMRADHGRDVPFPGTGVRVRDLLSSPIANLRHRSPRS